MYRRNRIHSLSILLSVVKHASTLFPLYLIFLFKFRDSLPFSILMNTIIFSLVPLFILTFIAWMRWYRFTYTITEEQVILEQGWLNKKRKYIPKERIQAIHESQNIIHRLFGLTELQIDTAGSREGAEIVLQIITKEEASQIQGQLSERRRMIQEDIAVLPIFTLSNKKTFLYAATSGSIGFVFSVLLGIYTEIDEYVSIHFKLENFQSQTPSFYGEVAIAVLTAGWLLGTLLVYQKYHGFTVVKQKDELVITRGLFEKKKLIVPLDRIQAIKVEENIIRQWLGYATIRFVSASSSSKEEEYAGFRLVCFPLVKRSHIPYLLQRYFPDYRAPSSFQHLPKRSFERYMIRVIVPVLLFIAITLSQTSMVKYVAPIFLIVGAVLGYRRYYDARWCITGEQLTVIYRRIGRITVYTKKSHIQALTVSKTVLQESASLCNVKICVKSGAGNMTFRIKDADDIVGTSLRRWYSYEKESDFA
ncbi:PH domain-containing protein [Bacillus rhizoplanae]|uniref:PH domain-containing protein n=1 Tax=Bacillus rhizoplanae TaxID=2880966 RepID=UPI003D1CDFBD